MTIAVIDIGKTNVKLTVVDPAGKSLHQVQMPNRVRLDGPYPHHDVDAIWAWLLESLAAYGRSGDIDAIVTTTHGATMALLAGDGLALPVLDYEYEGVEAISADYDAIRPQFRETGSPALPAGLNLGRQLYWLESGFPESFAAVTELLPYPQYWGYRLCGVKATEVTSLGCHTDLWNPSKRDYSSLAVGRGWQRLMPPLRRADEVLGCVDPELARVTGLRRETRIVCGVHDSNASYFCHRIGREPPFSVVSSGTWTICMAAGADPARLDESADMLANVDVFGDPVPCARFMGGREFAAIAGEGAAGPEPDMTSVKRILSAGIFALPAFASQGGPFRFRQGGVVPEMPAGKMERAALGALYCALMTDYCLDALGAAGDLVIEGSLARNSVFLGILAALRCEQAVIPSSDSTGTTIGAACLAGLRFAEDGAAANARKAVFASAHEAVLKDYRRDWRKMLALADSPPTT